MTDDAIRTAPLSKRWLRKMIIFVIVLIAFGTWGLYDAVSVYPKRGERHAAWMQMSYLEASRAANDEDFGVFERQSSVTDPVAELARLNSPEQRQRNAADAADSASSRNLRAVMQNSRRAWLEGLDRIGRLTPERTIIDNPQAELTRLRAELATAKKPKPLSAFDIPSQWLIMIVCWAVAAWMLIHAVRVAARKYRWNSATRALTIPGGHTITPDDLEEIDKRKWDKFIVFLKIKPNHPALGGKEVRCDTYQRDELEGWILEMEREAFGPQEDELKATDAEPVNTAESAPDAGIDPDPDTGVEPTRTNAGPDAP
jgi:hypothetical protein